MSNYDIEPWHDLFVATAGAGAALAGLVFVAVSINIAQILRLQGMPERGLQTVLLLLGSLVVSVVGLVPQTTTALAVEAVGVGSALLAFFAVTSRPVLAGTQGHPLFLATRLLTLLPGSVLYVVGGISLLIGRGGGLAWLVAGIVGAFIGASRHRGVADLVSVSSSATDSSLAPFPRGGLRHRATPRLRDHPPANDRAVGHPSILCPSTWRDRAQHRSASRPGRVT